MPTQTEMVDTIRRYGVRNRLVLKAITEVDRTNFVLNEYKANAYVDEPLPIGFGQTASQPYTIARMLELGIEGWPVSKLKQYKALEIGTGSGWQTALLAKIFNCVYSVEKIAQLAKAAQATVKKLNFTNIHIKIDDGRLGWPDQAPYQLIIVSAESANIPPALVEQLAPHGRIVIPIRGEMQRGTKTGDHLLWEAFGQYVFVPLV